MAITFTENIDAVLNEAHDAYKQHGSRSTKKLDIFHGALVSEISASMLSLIAEQNDDDFPVGDPVNRVIERGYEIKSKREDGKGKEKNLTTAIDSQNIDIYIKNIASSVEASVEVKFPLGNFAQNRKNNVLNILGICALMDTTKAEDSVYHTVCLCYPVNAPYFTNGKKFKHQESLDIELVISEYNRLLSECPDKAPYALSLMFFEFVPDNADDVAGSFERGEVSVKSYDVSDIVAEMDLMPELFVNDTAGFSDSIADACVNLSKQDLIRMREERSMYSILHKELGDKFEEMTEGQKQWMFDNLIANMHSLASSLPTI